MVIMLDVALTILTLATAASTLSVNRCPRSLNRDQYLQTYGNYCYEFVMYREVEFDDAIRACKGKGGNLVKVLDGNVQRFLGSQLSNRYHQDEPVWIGLTDHNTDDVWEWSLDGTAPRYQNWAPGQPGIGHSIGFEDCCAMKPDDGWRWNDYRCTDLLFVHFGHPYICQYGPYFDPTTTTPRPTTPEKTYIVPTRTTAWPTKTTRTTTNMPTTATGMPTTTLMPIVPTTPPTTQKPTTTPMPTTNMPTTTTHMPTTTQMSTTVPTIVPTTVPTTVPTAVPTTVLTTVLTTMPTTVPTTVPTTKMPTTTPKPSTAMPTTQMPTTTKMPTTTHIQTTKMPTTTPELSTAMPTTTQMPTTSTMILTTREPSTQMPTTTTTTTTMMPTTTVGDTCPPFACSLDCGLDGYKTDAKGCSLCECQDRK